MKEPIDVLNGGNPLTLESLCSTYILEKILLSKGRQIEICAKTLLQSNEENEEQVKFKSRRRRYQGIVSKIVIIFSIVFYCY